jgi:hypothetical protein
MKTNEIFLISSYKYPIDKEYELGSAFKLLMDVIVVAKQYNDNQDGTFDVIIKAKPQAVIIKKTNE